MAQPDILENRTFDEIAVGDAARLSRTLTKDDIDLYAALAGETAPEPAAEGDGPVRRLVAPGLGAGTLIAELVGSRLPGPGTVLLGQDLEVLAPVGLGDVLTATVTVRAKDPEHHRVVLDARCDTRDGRAVVAGTVRVRAPDTRQRRPTPAAAVMHVHRHAKYDRLVARSRDIPPVPTAVAHPCDESALAAAVDAARAGIITPILVGPPARIDAVADRLGVDLGGFERVAAPHSHASAAAAVDLVRCGRAALLMKGSLHTDELMAAVVRHDTGLRTERRISHVFIVDVPTYPKPLFITDAAINIAPTLEDKADIVRNAIDLARALDIDPPRVAILSAVETVNPKIPSTVEAAALCKMAERGQITGALLDGPLALDNAISEEAARIKNIVSPVAGRADILVVPDLEAGNMLAKNLIFLADADAAGLVLGARVPIVLTSRADSVRTRLASCAVAAVVAQRRLAAQPIPG